jgi:hypothetical protein
MVCTQIFGEKSYEAKTKIPPSGIFFKMMLFSHIFRKNKFEKKISVCKGTFYVKYVPHTGITTFSCFDRFSKFHFTDLKHYSTGITYQKISYLSLKMCPQEAFFEKKIQKKFLQKNRKTFFPNF